MLTHIAFVLGLEKSGILGSLSIAALGSYYSAECRRHNTILLSRAPDFRILRDLLPQSILNMSNVLGNVVKISSAYGEIGAASHLYAKLICRRQRTMSADADVGSASNYHYANV